MHVEHTYINIIFVHIALVAYLIIRFYIFTNTDISLTQIILFRFNNLPDYNLLIQSKSTIIVIFFSYIFLQELIPIKS